MKNIRKSLWGRLALAGTGISMLVGCQMQCSLKTYPVSMDKLTIEYYSDGSFTKIIAGYPEHFDIREN